MLEFNRFFKSRNLASTLKPTFLKCLLDIGDCKADEGSQWVNQTQNQYEVDLNFIAARFIRYYWPLHFIFKIKQEATHDPIVVCRILDKFSELTGKKTQPTKEQLCHTRFTPMRLEIIRDGIKPQVLKKLLNDCNIYSVPRGSNSITISKEIVNFMKENNDVLVSAINNTMAEYLEGFNSSPNISRCLREVFRRPPNLSAPKFKEILEMQDSLCFYCDTQKCVCSDCEKRRKEHKKPKQFAQDHFIPFNFVRDTKNYNIVASCHSCNSSKLDRLTVEKYLTKILTRNESLDTARYGYTPAMMKGRYENCRAEYHGMEQVLWEP